MPQPPHRHDAVGRLHSANAPTHSRAPPGYRLPVPWPVRSSRLCLALQPGPLRFECPHRERGPPEHDPFVEPSPDLGKLRPGVGANARHGHIVREHFGPVPLDREPARRPQRREQLEREGLGIGHAQG